VVEETYPGVYVDELPCGVTAIEGVPTSTAAFVGLAPRGPVDAPIDVTSLVDYERTFGPSDEADPMRLALMLFFANGGTDAVVVRAGGGLVPEPPTGGGLRALDAVDRFDLLCLPGLGIDPGQVAAALEAASRYCATRGAILLIDPLPAWGSVSDAVSGPRSIGALTAYAQRENAAAFYPDLLVPTAAGDVACGPAGAVAGVMARTDKARGVWKVAAGLEAAIRGTAGPALPVSSADAVALREVGVNAIRAFPDAGTLVWGARLLAGATRPDPEWNYIPIRRLDLFLEATLDKGLQWVVFEPNDEPLWAKVRQAIGAFLWTLFQKGAFAGLKPEESYFVKCGRDTMTQDEIDAGVVNIVVGFAPLRPSEFVIIRIGRFRPDD
jgi:phage tail sheath protein FI